MNREKMEKEHAQLKERLSELTDFINSEAYYKLSETEKQLIAAQRSGMEVYINALSIRLWGKGSSNGAYSPSLLGLVTSLMFAPSFGSQVPEVAKVAVKEEDKEKTAL